MVGKEGVVHHEREHQRLLRRGFHVGGRISDGGLGQKCDDDDSEQEKKAQGDALA